MNNLKDVLYQSKQSIDANKYEQTTGTPAMTFHKPVGGEIRISDLGMSHREFATQKSTSFRINELLSG